MGDAYYQSSYALGNLYSGYPAVLPIGVKI